MRVRIEESKTPTQGSEEERRGSVNRDSMGERRGRRGRSREKRSMKKDVERKLYERRMENS